MEQLTPGTYAVARGHDRLQIGIGERSIVIPRTSAAQALLDTIDNGPIRLNSRDPLTRGLRTHRLVTPAPVPDGLSRRLAIEDPTGWQERLARRRAAGVLVLGELDVDPRPLLATCGFAGAPTAALVLGRVAPDPAYVDDLVRGAVPHLLLTCTDAGVRLGPFVVPGETACAACLQLHRSADDPELPDVERRYRAATDADPERPADNQVLLTMATAWAVRDLTAWIDGEHPTTWSSTIWLGPAGPPEVTTWMRHPECGCNWSHTWGDATSSGSVA